MKELKGQQLFDFAKPSAPIKLNVRIGVIRSNLLALSDIDKIVQPRGDGARDAYDAMLNDMMDRDDDHGFDRLDDFGDYDFN